MSIRTVACAAALALVCASCGLAVGVKEETPYTIPAPAPEVLPARESDARLIQGSGIPLDDYDLSETTENKQEYVTRTYSRRQVSGADKERESNVVAAIDELHAQMPSLREIVARFGPPTRMLFALAQNVVFINAFYGELQLFFADDPARLGEIRLGGKAPSYLFRGKLRLGSSLEQVLAELGQPIRTAKGTEPDWADRVLSYYDYQGRFQYIRYESEGVRFFFEDEKVAALYLFDPEPTVTLEPWADVRQAGLSAFAGVTDASLMRTLWFSASQAFPQFAAAIASEVLERGKNPGLGVLALHARGITGKGVAVAIIDQNLPGTDHPEYAGKVAAYHDAGTSQPANRGSMHGPAVLSLLVGSTIGTAPDARVWYAAAPSWTADAKYEADSLRWIIAENAKLPADGKIRVVSVSAAPSGPGSPFTRNGADWDAAVADAEAAGILVLDCTQGHGRIGPGYYDPDRPEDVATCSPGYPGMTSGGAGGDRILAPTSYRTQAEQYTAGSPSYQYTGRGGLSWGIPYAAGVLAMGWQVNPALTGVEMMALLERTAYALPGSSRMIDPGAFVAAVEKTVIP